MTTASKSAGRSRPAPEPPPLHGLPVLHAPEEVRRWLDFYWHKLGLPPEEQTRLAITQDRQEFARWTGRRLNTLALGCYCYLPSPPLTRRQRRHLHLSQAIGAQTEEAAAVLTQLLLPSFAVPPVVMPQQQSALSLHRHLIFVEPDLLPQSVEVTVAHELIHLADRVRGQPRRHRCHGYDSISVDEAAITGYPPEELRALLREETTRREKAARAVRPIRYVYACPRCGKEYRRVRRYPRSVSCGACDHAYNPAYALVLKETLDSGAKK
jgi:predicted SprT family Zn-dependent metalloprotease